MTGHTKPNIQAFTPLLTVGAARGSVGPRGRALLLLVREGRSGLEPARWGLIPSWVERPQTFGLNLTEAPLATAAEAPEFKRALERRRCVTAAQTVQVGDRLLCAGDRSALLLAGVFERRRDYRSESVSFALLTRLDEAGSWLPVLLRMERLPEWLAGETGAAECLDQTTLLVAKGCSVG